MLHRVKLDHSGASVSKFPTGVWSRWEVLPTHFPVITTKTRTHIFILKAMNFFYFMVNIVNFEDVR